MYRLHSPGHIEDRSEENCTAYSYTGRSSASSVDSINTCLNTF
jgi:hypothetical protein